jgi:peptidoglycan hydrolase-like protein with peptidoglycan-binding domain
MKKLLIGGFVAFAVVLGAFASTAQAYNFASDLTVGSTGADVVALQTWLVNNGYLVMPAGTAMGYFGQITKTAVAKYQANVGLPSTGFFGPLTRAKLSMGGAVVTTPATTVAGCPVGAAFNTMTGAPCGVASSVAGCTAGAMFSSTTGQRCDGSSSTPSSGSISTSGVEGDLTRFGKIGGTESTVDEGQRNVQVLGVKFKAEDSDMLIERVDVDFTITPALNASARLRNYITAVSLVLDGKRIATLSESRATRTGNVNSFRFTGLKGLVPEGRNSELYVAVDAVSSIDSTDSNSTIAVEIPQNGIRAVDGAGISDTYGTSGLTETFNVESATAGDLDITIADASPKARTVEADLDNQTRGVTLLVFELEADKQDIEITDLPVGLGSTGATVFEIVRSVSLVQGTKTLDTVSIPSSASGNYYRALFEDIDLMIDEGETVTLKVVADINKLSGAFGSGDSVAASTTQSTVGWNVEDSEGNSIVPDGIAQGEVQTFRNAGVNVEKISTSAVQIFNKTDVSTDDQGSYTVVFDVTAFKETAFIDLSAGSTTVESDTGVNYLVKSAVNGTVITAGTSSATLSHNSGGSRVGNYVRINKGQTARFTLNVLHDAAVSGQYRAQLYSVNYNNTQAAANAQEVVAPDYEFETGSVQILN